MGSIFHGWGGQWVYRGLGLALLGLTVGCTNNGTNTLPNRNQLPPPKTINQSGVLPINSPAYNNIQGNNPPANGVGVNAFNNFSPSNGTPTLPTTRITAPESARPDTRAAMNPQIGIPTNPTNNPASFNGPYSGNNTYPPNNPIQPAGYNPQSLPPVQQMQPLPSNSANRVPAMNPIPSNNPATNPAPVSNPALLAPPPNPALMAPAPVSNTNAPAWPNPNPPANSNSGVNPANWNAPSNSNPVPPPPPVGYNTPSPSNGLAPLKLPESVSAKPINTPTIQPVGASSTLEPMPDNTPAPIMAPSTKVISSYPLPQQPRRDMVPPVIIGSDEIPAAPVIPQR